MFASLAAIDTLHPKEMGENYQSMGLLGTMGLCRNQGCFAHDTGDPDDTKIARSYFSAGAMVLPFRGQMSNVELRITEEDIIY